MHVIPDFATALQLILLSRYVVEYKRVAQQEGIRKKQLKQGNYALSKLPDYQSTRSQVLSRMWQASCCLSPLWHGQCSSREILYRMRNGISVKGREHRAIAGTGTAGTYASGGGER